MANVMARYNLTDDTVMNMNSLRIHRLIKNTLASSATISMTRYIIVYFKG